MRAEPTDDAPKSVLVDSILDDMPVFITDKIASISSELFVSESKQQVTGDQGMAGWENGLAGNSEPTGDGEATDVEQVVVEEVVRDVGRAAAEVRVINFHPS